MSKATELLDMLENVNTFTKATDKMRAKFSNLIGKRFKDSDGEWEFVDVNDLGVPYFSKVKNGKIQSKQFIVRGFSKQWAERQLSS